MKAQFVSSQKPQIRGIPVFAASATCRENRNQAVTRHSISKTSLFDIPRVLVPVKQERARFAPLRVWWTSSKRIDSELLTKHIFRYYMLAQIEQAASEEFTWQATRVWLVWLVLYATLVRLPMCPTILVDLNSAISISYFSIILLQHFTSSKLILFRSRSGVTRRQKCYSLKSFNINSHFISFFYLISFFNGHTQTNHASSTYQYDCHWISVLYCDQKVTVFQLNESNVFDCLL